MTKLRFSYEMSISYEYFAEKCYFTVKCFPADDLRQRVLNVEHYINPKCEFSRSLDYFGNKQLYGSIALRHDAFKFGVLGEVEILPRSFVNQTPIYRAGMFLAPHGKCIPGAALFEYYKSLGVPKGNDPYRTCIRIMRLLHKDFSYLAGVTGTDTTAEQAWLLGRGVCQDYVHIYITLLRMAGIPARYVSGATIGEGHSHAWAEALCKEKWMPFDPTANCIVTDGHIKFNHGRDATDCAINRGILWNCGAQTQEISAFVQKV